MLTHLDSTEFDEGARALIGAMDALRAQRETQRYKRHSYRLVPIRATRVLDVGCGTGDDVLAMAERCGPTTEVVGLERRAALVVEANRRARNVALNVHFMEGDARAMPFTDRAFDVVRADRLLDEVDDKDRVIAELVRVVRPGGRVVVLDRARLSAPRVRACAFARRARAKKRDFVLLLLCSGLVDVKVEHRWTSVDATDGATLEGLTVVGTRPDGPVATRSDGAGEGTHV